MSICVFNQVEQQLLLYCKFYEISIGFFAFLDPTNPVVSKLATGADSISVSWTLDPNSFIALVTVRRADGLALSPSVMVANDGAFLRSDGTEGLISNLAPGTRYIVTVIVFTEVKRSDPIMITLITG